MIDTLLWTLLGYLSGSILYCYWLSLWIKRVDIRGFGDGNPGGMNAMKYADWRIGFPAAVLDFLKGLVPVALARSYGVSGWGLALVALAPVVGHAWPVFSNFQGGKALAATVGVWLILAGAPGVLAYAVFALVLLALQRENALAALAGMFGLGLQLLLTTSPDYLFTAWAANLAILLWKHRHELREPLQFRPWTSGLFSRRAP